MQSIARDSDESSDDEYFDAHGRWLFPGGPEGRAERVWAEGERKPPGGGATARL